MITLARIRTIKPEFFRHEELYELEISTKLPIRIAYAGLWTCCDREGRFKWRPRSLKVEILPYDNLDFSRVLDALATRGFCVKYRVDNEEFGYVPSFHAHQFVNNRESPSTIPEPSLNEQLDASVTRDSREEHATSTNVVKEGKGKEGDMRVENAPFVLPEWVPTDLWNDFEEICKKKKAPRTPRARTLALNSLDKLRLSGYSPSAVLENSIERGYTGLFEPKQNGNGKPKTNHIFVNLEDLPQ